MDKANDSPYTPISDSGFHQKSIALKQYLFGPCALVVIGCITMMIAVPSVYLLDGGIQPGHHPSDYQIMLAYYQEVFFRLGGYVAMIGVIWMIVSFSLRTRDVTNEEG